MAQSLTTNVRLKYCQTIGGFYSVAHNTSSNGMVCYGMVWYVISYLSDRGFFKWSAPKIKEKEQNLFLGLGNTRTIYHRLN